jgi:hypothetical protein
MRAKLRKPRKRASSFSKREKILRKPSMTHYSTVAKRVGGGRVG